MHSCPPLFRTIQSEISNIDAYVNAGSLKSPPNLRFSSSKMVCVFFQGNRWIKRGLATVVMTYPFFLFGNFNAQLSVYAGDGSVSITHAGVEMGQGINTKVAAKPQNKFFLCKTPPLFL